MANEYAVNAADLTTVADAIRDKSGTSESLSFPDGFASAIAGISTGAQVASGSFTASKADSMTINPGFVVKNICCAVAYNTSTASSNRGGGMYIDGAKSGDISTIVSTAAATRVDFSKEFSKTIYWLATS